MDKKNYEILLERISEVYTRGRNNAAIAVSQYLVETYWNIGQYIVEFEQEGNLRAEYGKELLPKLSKDLSLSLGKGFSLSNLIRMRQFYSTYPIYAELPHKLSWTHWVELLKIDNDLERSFYLNQSITESWSTTELIRQKKTSLFLRLAASKDKEGVLELSKQGIKVQKPADIIREPYILDFLKSSQLFVSKYQLYLPEKELLENKLTQILQKNNELNN
ncbi:MAG: DUF1016 N-terminal domain-containing protein [Bacteroidales bacterium]|nr:DUF1016 N-terminal domain-containing protein [Bacteroidales bacterium]